MPIPLSSELVRAIDEAAEVPPRLVDPATNTTYILLRAEDYSALLARLAGETSDDRAWLDAGEEASPIGQGRTPTNDAAAGRDL